MNIPLKQYCPHMKNLPLSREDIIRAQVQKEDEANHRDSVAPKLPAYKKVKIPFSKTALYAFGMGIINVTRP